MMNAKEFLERADKHLEEAEKWTTGLLSYCNSYPPMDNGYMIADAQRAMAHTQIAVAYMQRSLLG